MKQKIEDAQRTHTILTGEIVTDIAIAAILWPESRLQTQRQNLYNLMSGRTRLNIDHVTVLVGLFPHTDANYWTGIGEVDDDVYRDQAVI